MRRVKLHFLVGRTPCPVSGRLRQGEPQSWPGSRSLAWAGWLGGQVAQRIEGPLHRPIQLGPGGIGTGRPAPIRWVRRDLVGRHAHRVVARWQALGFLTRGDPMSGERRRPGRCRNPGPARNRPRGRDGWAVRWRSGSRAGYIDPIQLGPGGIGTGRQASVRWGCAGIYPLSGERPLRDSERRGWSVTGPSAAFLREGRKGGAGGGMRPCRTRPLRRGTVMVDRRVQGDRLPCGTGAKQGRWFNHR